MRYIVSEGEKREKGEGGRGKREKGRGEREGERRREKNRRGNPPIFFWVCGIPRRPILAAEFPPLRCHSRERGNPFGAINFRISAHFFAKKRGECGSLPVKMDSRFRGNDGGFFLFSAGMSGFCLRGIPPISPPILAAAARFLPPNSRLPAVIPANAGIHSGRLILEFPRIFSQKNGVNAGVYR